MVPEVFFLTASRLSFAASPLNSVSPNEKKTSGTQGRLNLDPNNSTKLIQEFDIISFKISSEELKNFETCIPELMIRPVAEKFPYDRNNVYNFVNYGTETNTSGKTTEICQLSAVDKSGLYSFND